MVLPLAGSLVLGGVTAGLGLLQARQQRSAEKQQYANDLAMQNANQAFAQWQAGFTKQYTDANQQYQFWQSTVAYNQQRAYVNSLRNFELSKAIAQAEVVGQTRAASAADFALQSQALTQQFAEASMADAVAYQQYQVAALKARGTAAAAGQEGASIDRLMNDYARQEGDYATIQQLNKQLRGQQLNRAQTAQVTQFLSRYNSQPFYEQQPYLEPMRPFQPLPTLLAPPPPSFTGAAPSRGAAVLNGLTGVMGGINAGIGTYSTLSNIKAGA
jgi:hypothetical protein